MPTNTARRQIVQARRIRLVRIKQAEKAIARWRADVERLDAAIAANGGPVRAYTPAVKPARRGGMAKAILNLLREAERPMFGAEIMDALTARGWGEGIGRAVLAGRVLMALGRQAANGTLRRERGMGRLVWSVTR